MITPSQLGASVQALGRLIGLLNPSGGNFSVNTGWFSDPSGNLSTAQNRIDQAVALLYNVLSTPAGQPTPPVVFPNANWLMIPDPTSGGDSPYYLVVPPNGQTTGQIGFGALLPESGGNLNIEVYVYVPLFNFSPTGTTFLLGQKGASLQVGLSLTNTSGSFSSGAVTFSSLLIDGTIYFDGSTPTAQVQFTNLKGTTAPSTYTTLASLLDVNVLDWVGTVLLSATSWLNTDIGICGITPGTLLTAAGFISVSNPDDEGDPQYGLTLSTLTSETAAQIATNFVFGVLNAILAGSNDACIIDLPNGGVFVTSQQNSDGSIDYGMRLQMQMALNDGSGSQSTAPAVTLCLGAWLSGEDNNSNWMTRSMAAGAAVPGDGLTIWLITRSTKDTMLLTPGFALSSIGVNITGNAGNPLFSISGYTLQGAELRATLNAVTLTDPSSWTFGFAAKLDQIGIPLLPSVSGSAGNGGNPVAQSLLQSSTTSSSGTGDTDPANPTFGIAMGWYDGGTFDVQLFDQNDQPSGQVLISSNRTLGPLDCQRLGIGWVNATDVLSLLFDGSVQVGPLGISLQGLTVGIPVTTPLTIGNYSLDLDGMGITYSAGSVNIDAAFVKVPPSTAKPYTEYDGTATIQAGTFAVTALGSYAYLPASGQQSGYASLFIFGALLTPLGGPEFFYVTGLAAGFGYNRGLLLPGMNNVPDFPLVAALNDPATLGATQSASGAWTFPDPVTVLSKMDSYLPPQRGEYWLAAGVRFTSFSLLNTSALLSIEFGNQLQIGITGISWMSVPPPPEPGATPPDTRFAYVELGIAIEIIPDDGYISATALLTNNSYVIDPACHLSGGFAFYAWFGSNPHAGEFVLTIGGYHPAFTPPSYYPTVPRLAFNWAVSDTVTISGDAYFALTSSAIMTGGGLQVLFSDGNLKAWFIAQMDALIRWAPFQYNVSISVSIGVSYRLHLLFVTVTLKVELGAGVILWGPRMGGVANISWYIISFSVNFGADQPAANPALAWTDSNGQGFAQTLLPHQTTSSSSGASARFATAQKSATGAKAKMALAATPPSTQPAGVLTITAASGVTSTFTDSNGNTVWVVRPADFSMSVLSSFPLTEIDITAASQETGQTKYLATNLCPDGANYYVCVRPMLATLSSSVMTITLTDDDTNQVYDLAGNFTLQPSIVSTQAAKWGQPVPAGSDPEMNAILNGRLFGFQSIVPKTTTLTPSGLNALTIDITTAFTADIVDGEPPYTTAHLPLSSSALPPGPIPAVSSSSWQTIQTALQSSTVTTARNAVYSTLVGQFGFDPQTNGPVTTFGNNPGAWLNGDPLILSSSNSAAL